MTTLLCSALDCGNINSFENNVGLSHVYVYFTWVLRKDKAQANKNQNPKSGDQPPGVIRCVHEDEDCKDKHHQEV